MTPDDDHDDRTDGEANEAAPVPVPIQEFAAELMTGDEVRYEFDEAVIDVPSRFDRASPTATWQLDGTVTVRVRHVDE